MKWALTYLVIAAIGTLVWAIRFAIRENKLDKLKQPLDYPDWVDEQKRRRISLSKESGYILCNECGNVTVINGVCEVCHTIKKF